jgi:hypothetical protein
MQSISKSYASASLKNAEQLWQSPICHYCWTLCFQSIWISRCKRPATPFRIRSLSEVLSQRVHDCRLAARPREGIHSSSAIGKGEQCLGYMFSSIADMTDLGQCKSTIGRPSLITNYQTMSTPRSFCCWILLNTTLLVYCIIGPCLYNDNLSQTCMNIFESAFS